jgi:signal transduction histidine kinase
LEAAQNDRRELPSLLVEALENAEQAMSELRDLAHGILPAALTQGGLASGVQALQSRMPIPVEVDVPPGRLSAAVEATAYFVIAEALTNVVKHAHAKRAAVRARIQNGVLTVRVHDDGLGGARPEGTGLLGIADRLAVVGGRLRVQSPSGDGTLLVAAIPLGDSTSDL